MKISVLSDVEISDQMHNYEMLFITKSLSNFTFYMNPLTKEIFREKNEKLKKVKKL